MGYFFFGRSPERIVRLAAERRTVTLWPLHVGGFAVFSFFLKRFCIFYVLCILVVLIEVSCVLRTAEVDCEVPTVDLDLWRSRRDRGVRSKRLDSSWWFCSDLFGVSW